ncbi:MAG: hypothetical protein ABIJ31_07285 [Pseudomonadota bacterium]
MSFVLGVASLSVCVLCMGLFYMGGRNPQTPGWASEFWMGSVYVPTLMVLSIVSMGSFYLFIKNYGTSPLTVVHGGVAAAIAIVSILVWRFMDVKKRVKAYGQMGSKPVVNVNFQQAEYTTPPTSGNKAA